MADEDLQRLFGAILDFFQWLKPTEAARSKRGRQYYNLVLIEFLIFTIHRDIAWEDMFTFDTFRAFRDHTGLKGAAQALVSLSGFLHKKGGIEQPLEIPNYQVPLPEIYERFFVHMNQSRELCSSTLRSSRRVLASFHTYLENHKIHLSSLEIEHIDNFLAEFEKPFSMVTRKAYRTRLRGFLQYLYDEHKILRRDLAPLLRDPRLLTPSRPPKFLRPREIQKLFEGLSLDTPSQIRTYAMVYLAYTLGLRPVEISTLSLDDVSFKKSELILSKRKTDNPTTLPIPEKTLKAVAAYVLKVRPKIDCRALFLTLSKPHRPIGAGTVSTQITMAMKKVGLPSTAYWLRHSYAQNLLHMGRSIYEIKEMLGHGRIQSTQRYLYIHTELMRKVLLNETL